jgi:2-methylcitrate dehydratase
LEKETAIPSTTAEPTMVQSLGGAVAGASWEDLSGAVREELKKRILDGLACAIGGLGGPPVRAIRAQVLELGGSPLSTIVGGNRTSPDRAALHNGAAVRYLDFNDCYLGRLEACHPSDNLAPVLAASEAVGGHGRDLLTALAVAYQVQIRLCEVAPVRDRGFDHVTQGAYAAAAGVARALALDAEQTANAIAISGTAFNALRVTRTGSLSHWKGMAYPNLAFAATHAAYLARHGVTGPLEVFEGAKGFMDSIAGRFEIDWRREPLDAVLRTIIKRYNAEGHSQSCLEGVLELRQAHGVAGAGVERVVVDTFAASFNIIGGGDEGEKMTIRTKEEADHSLPYMVAVALLDGQVLPAQYEQARILAPDVQSLLRRVDVRLAGDLTDRFPDEHGCRIELHLRDGRVLTASKVDYAGFHTRPAGWDTLEGKFRQLSDGRVDGGLATEIVAAVRNLDQLPVAELTGLLAAVSVEEA